MRRIGWILLALAASSLAQTTGAKESAPDLTLGKRLYRQECAICHGEDGSGGRGPGLALPRWQNAKTDVALQFIIQHGVKGSEMVAAPHLSSTDAASIAAYVRSLAAESAEPPAIRGARAYAQQNCAACHEIGGQGNGWGGDLTHVGGRRTAAELRTALVTPGARVEEPYRVLEATTADRRAIRGVRAREEAGTLVLRDAEGRVHALRNTSGKELRPLPGVSLMPSYALLHAGEIEGLVAYLMTLR